MSNDDLDLTEAERDALHELPLGLESIYRGYGALLDCHRVGGGPDHFATAGEPLREGGHAEIADRLRETSSPRG